MAASELTDEEIDLLLERFDQTEPALQRRIIAQLVGDRKLLLNACKQAAEAAGKDWLQMQLMLAKTFEIVQTRRV